MKVLLGVAPEEDPLFLVNETPNPTCTTTKAMPATTHAIMIAQMKRRRWGVLPTFGVLQVVSATIGRDRVKTAKDVIAIWSLEIKHVCDTCSVS